MSCAVMRLLATRNPQTPPPDLGQVRHIRHAPLSSGFGSLDVRGGIDVGGAMTTRVTRARLEEFADKRQRCCKWRGRQPRLLRHPTWVNACSAWVKYILCG